MVGAGCGRGHADVTRKTAYEKRVQAVAERFGAMASHELLPAARMLVHDRPKAALKMSRGALVFMQEADALAAITPPKEVAQDHRALVAWLRALSRNESGLARLVKASATGELKPGEAASLLSGVKRALSRGDAALRDFKRKGYDLFGFTGGVEHVVTTTP